MDDHEDYYKLIDENVKEYENINHSPEEHEHSDVSQEAIKAFAEKISLMEYAQHFAKFENVSKQISTTYLYISKNQI